MAQGQSAATEAKARGISSTLAVNLNWFRGRWGGSRFRYFHFDLHSGSGWNDKVNVIGSPLAFVAAAERAQVDRWTMHTIDRDEEATLTLAQRPEMRDNRVRVLAAGDNAELCRMIPSIIRHHNENPRYATGTVLIDPNKPTGDTPWGVLTWLGRRCPRLDVIVNFPATGMKRIRTAIGSDHDAFVHIDELPGMFHKAETCWLIREPQPVWHFTLCVGRNHPFDDYKKAGFYKWNSPVGRDYRLRAMHTADEYRNRGQAELL